MSLIIVDPHSKAIQIIVPHSNLNNEYDHYSRAIKGLTKLKRKKISWLVSRIGNLKYIADETIIWWEAQLKDFLNWAALNET